MSELFGGPEINEARKDLSPDEKIENEINEWKLSPDDYIRVKGTDGSEICIGKDDDHMYLLRIDGSGNVLEDSINLYGGDFDKITVKELENSYKLILTDKTEGFKEELYNEIEISKSDVPVYEELYSLLKNEIASNFLKLQIDGVGYKTFVSNDMGKIRIENHRAGKYGHQLFTFNKNDVSTVSFSNDGFMKDVVIQTKEKNVISFKTTDQEIERKLHQQYLI